MRPPPAPSSSPQEPAARWVPGEYAECLHEASWFLRGALPNRAGPGVGEVAKVRSVVLKTSPWSSRPVEMLTFARWPGSAFPSSSFRKVAKPKFTLGSIKRAVRREPHTAGIGAAAIATAVCYGAAAVAQIFGGEQ